MYMFGGEGLDFFLVRKYGNVVIYLYVFYYLYNLLMLELFNEENLVNRYRLIDKIILKIDFLMLLLIFLVQNINLMNKGFDKGDVIKYELISWLLYWYWYCDFFVLDDLFCFIFDCL